MKVPDSQKEYRRHQRPKYGANQQNRSRDFHVVMLPYSNSPRLHRGRGSKFQIACSASNRWLTWRGRRVVWREIRVGKAGVRPALPRNCKARFLFRPARLPRESTEPQIPSREREASGVVTFPMYPPPIRAAAPRRSWPLPSANFGPGDIGRRARQIAFSRRLDAHAITSRAIARRIFCCLDRGSCHRDRGDPIFRAVDIEAA